nr:hypothetical protein Iba_chr12cCG19380 [Ipomoea batatas]
MGLCWLVPNNYNLGMQFTAPYRLLIFTWPSIFSQQLNKCKLGAIQVHYLCKKYIHHIRFHSPIRITIGSSIKTDYVFTVYSHDALHNVFYHYIWVYLVLFGGLAPLSSDVQVTFELSLHSQTARLHSPCFQGQHMNLEEQRELQASLQTYLMSPHQSHIQIRSTSHRKHCISSS